MSLSSSSISTQPAGQMHSSTQAKVASSGVEGEKQTKCGESSQLSPRGYEWATFSSTAVTQGDKRGEWGIREVSDPATRESIRSKGPEGQAEYKYSAESRSRVQGKRNSLALIHSPPPHQC